MFNSNEFREKLEKVIADTRDNLSSIRTGRATPALIENILVTTYAGQATLRVIELATVVNNGPQELLVVPFDQSVLPDLEKALREASMGLSVTVSGNQIRVKTPPLSEEQRGKYAKLVSEYAEEGREAIRLLRDEVRRGVKLDFETKQISEDEKYRLETEIDKISKEYTERIDEMRERKEEEVMSI